VNPPDKIFESIFARWHLMVVFAFCAIAVFNNCDRAARSGSTSVRSRLHNNDCITQPSSIFVRSRSLSNVIASTNPVSSLTRSQSSGEVVLND